MANPNEPNELVSQAWDRQRQGNPDAAITEFQKIVQQYPKDIDANYGLALAQKAAGQTEAAIKTFKNTLELIEDSRNIYESTRERSGEQENIKTPEDDRYMMLSRMVKQRLAELEKSAKTEP